MGGEVRGSGQASAGSEPHTDFGGHVSRIVTMTAGFGWLSGVYVLVNSDRPDPAGQGDPKRDQRRDQTLNLRV